MTWEWKEREGKEGIRPERKGKAHIKKGQRESIVGKEASSSALEISTLQDGVLGPPLTPGASEG